MPIQPAKPCRHAGCGALVRDGSGYCEKHQGDKKQGKFADAHRGSRHERGYGTDWEKTRKRILHRDVGLCQVCLKAGKTRPAKQVDHIMGKAEGKSVGWSHERIEADENLQSICKPCHDSKTAEEAVRARR